jgi:hypothetical protein
VTSPPDLHYNCIGFAAGRSDVVWWPDEYPDPQSDYWPQGILREESVPAFVELFQSLGYELCSDGDLEARFEKVAIYALGQKPTHAARQLTTGAWTSKLGVEEDIVHEKPESLDGPCYGSVVQFLRRPTS